ncbi:hypothetical protein [Labrys monachus]|uniref:DUF3329 domain-containing protein n=1 Tax=Labrys monachus TaxID=217067 RepID=A0ABU0FIP9_9HYPH|nr:hypothetical protein [Labrys monachus]MDQ0393978.1 hypothetical protein [Labrys monachus]
MMPAPETPNWMRPLWVRLALCLAPAAWAAGELWHGNQMWGSLFGIIAAYGAWIYIVRYRPPEG